MLFDIVSKIRFGFSLIVLWFKLLKISSIDKKKGSKVSYPLVKVLAKNHTDELINIAKINLFVEGLENIPEEPVVFMGNHQSYIDIYVTLNTLTIKRNIILIGKQEIKKIPIISKLAKYYHVLFLDRENPREGLKTILEAINLIKNENFDVLIYPEGTRSKRTEMSEFHKGSFKIAQKSQAPIIPMVVNNAYKVFEETYKVKKGIDVHLAFLEPIYLDRLDPEDAKNIDEYVKNRIQSKLDEFTRA